MNDKCKNLFGGIRCNFEPRYDVGSPLYSNIKGGAFIEDLIEALKPRTYVCDVCTACGEQRPRPK